MKIQDMIELVKEKGLISKDLVFEVCGTWIWVSGKTFPFRNSLKSLGFRWAPKKQQWYWHEGQYHKLSRHSWSMEEIEEKFGADLISG